MVMIEMREAAQDKALDLVEELHELGHQKKMILCELEDTLYDCFEKYDDKEDDESEEGKDLGFKNKYMRRYGMRNFDDDTEDDATHHMYRRRSMRMRRNRARV